MACKLYIIGTRKTSDFLKKTVKSKQKYISYKNRLRRIRNSEKE